MDKVLNTTQSLIWASIEKIGKQTLQFILGIIIARLLIPEDYGIIGMLSIFMELSSMILSAGIGYALIQKQDRTEEDFSTAFYINILSLVISIIVFSIISLFYSHFDFQSKKATLKAGFTINSENQSDMENVNSNQIIKTEEKNESWFLEIPVINLKAEIQEGTTKEIMDKYIGHFSESKKWIGNVCLAAHNRGYENNYFSDLKNLKEDDKIIYQYDGLSREYKVMKNNIIKDTDLSCLQNTEDNIITLITCVENSPTYRRCIQAIEKEEK